MKERVRRGDMLTAAGEAIDEGKGERKDIGAKTFGISSKLEETEKERSIAGTQ